MKFPPEMPVSYSINTERVLSHGEYVSVCVIKLTDSFNKPDQIKWRKKGSSTWISGAKNSSGYISSSFGAEAMFEPGETYDFIFEFTKSMNVGRYQAVTSRTEMEIKIETTQ